MCPRVFGDHRFAIRFGRSYPVKVKTDGISNRRTVKRISLIVLLVLSVPFAPAKQPDRASIRVDLSAPGVNVSPMLYGIFFEEINHAGDGGLYAEMVQNRSFEDSDSPESWTAQRSTTIALDLSRPLNERNPKSLKMVVPEGGGGASNAGFWGIAVQKAKRYRLNLWTRAETTPRVVRLLSPTIAGNRAKAPRMQAWLVNPDGKVIASAGLRNPATAWSNSTATLTANLTEPKASLVIHSEGPATVWIDMVSLVPEDTWMKRKNGLRRDLMQKLADLKPAFFRFPGGCFVEGGRLANAFRWKETIGPIEERPGHMNDKWGYYSTDGLGFHEYLQMCEDLKAAPMFVINCGMACAFSSGELIPLNDLDPWIQDALDAIEYANGPVSSKWGALRAKNGHPKPFNMKYLEVGNENGWGNTLSAYEDRYARFYDAVKKWYPEIQVIATTRIRNRPMDLLDDHYYNSPAWLINNSTLYDRYDRSGPKVYVGEYAVTSGAGTGNLSAALAEAAFMCGFERNADVITMSSYAPLFVNVNDRKWNPDLICFDSARGYATPSYYVQQMFAQNRPDVSYPVKVESPVLPFNPPTGMIGLGTWRTQSEYKEVRVTQGDRVLFEDDFKSGAGRWKVVRGEWKVGDGAFRQSGPQENLRALAGDSSWQDYTLTLKARKLGGAEGFLIMFRSRDDRNWYWWNIGGWNNIQHAVQKEVGGAPTLVSPYAPGRVETGRWYDIRIELQGPRIRCYLDDKLIHDIEEREPRPLTATAGLLDKTGEVILKVVNTSSRPQETEITLDGIRGTAATGKAWVMTSARPQDENSFAEPLRVSPKSETINGIGRTFRRTFPATSLSIFRITAVRSAAQKPLPDKEDLAVLKAVLKIKSAKYAQYTVGNKTLDLLKQYRHLESLRYGFQELKLEHLEKQFRARNEREWPLDDLKGDSRIRLVSPGEMSRLAGGGTGEAYIQLSLPAFTRDRSEAVLYYQNPGLSGSLFHLRKRGGQWTLVGERMLWIA